MASHEFLEFCALLASGVMGALIVTPLQRAMVAAVERARPGRDGR